MVFTNTLKTTALLAGIGALFVFLGSFFGSGGMVIGLVIGLAFTGGSYWFSDKLAIKSAGARPFEPGELPHVQAMVQELAAEADIPMPALYVAPSMQPNAFATGRNPKHAAVAVTQGILHVLDERELRAVIAHELSHVKNRDILITSIAASVGTAISFVANFAMFFGGGNDEERPNPVAALLMMFLAPLAASILQMALSRSREFEADRSGAELLHGGEDLARALLKIEAYARQVPMNIEPSQAQAYIINPLTGREMSFRNLFTTHPPTEQRVERLRAFGRTYDPQARL
jgi:heat shock protein HtpX